MHLLWVTTLMHFTSGFRCPWAAVRDCSPFDFKSAPANSLRNSCVRIQSHLRVAVKYPVYASSECVFCMLFSCLRYDFVFYLAFPSPLPPLPPTLCPVNKFSCTWEKEMCSFRLFFSPILNLILFTYCSKGALVLPALKFGTVISFYYCGIWVLPHSSFLNAVYAALMRISKMQSVLKSPSESFVLVFLAVQYTEGYQAIFCAVI